MAERRKNSNIFINSKYIVVDDDDDDKDDDDDNGDSDDKKPKLETDSFFCLTRLFVGFNFTYDCFDTILKCGGRSSEGRG